MKQIIHGQMDDNKKEDDFNPLYWICILISVIMLTIMIFIVDEYEKKQQSGVAQKPTYTEQVPLPTIQPVQTRPADINEKPIVSSDLIEEDIKPSELVEPPVVIESKEILSDYKELYEVNNDMVGYIYLPEGNAYPVMQRVQDQNYYLYRNFHEEDDKEGIPFLNRYSELGTSGISLIYGHTLKNGRQFGRLKYFEDEEYFEEHRTIRIDTLYEKVTYEVVAVALTSLHEDFEYYLYVGDVTENDFNDWKLGFEEYCIRGSLQDLSYGDTIVELSACAYHTEDGRLVVILKAIS